ncbi:MAG: methyltransferase domain-containing protein [Deltaproteobacteria bacterium]|nr:methyltransferase domain-containing protein [Deltaproteobacteria bacterium]
MGSARSKYGTSSYRRAYAFAAPIYDLLHILAFALHGGRRKVWTKAIRSVPYGEGETILDACCGTGYLAKLLLDRVKPDAQIVGIDLSPSQIRVAEKRVGASNVRFLTGDVRDIPFEDDHFEKSFISFALHEMPADVRRAVLLDVVRVTKRDGAIVILEGNRPSRRSDRFLMYVTFFQWWPWCVDHPHSQEVWRTDYVSELTNCGMTIVTREEFARGFFQLIVARPAVPSGAPKGGPTTCAGRSSSS